MSLFERLRWRDRNLITHEVNPRFLSSFLRSATVSLSQLLERRRVETNERLLIFTALDKGLAAGRRMGSILNSARRSEEDAHTRDIPSPYCV